MTYLQQAISNMEKRDGPQPLPAGSRPLLFKDHIMNDKRKYDDDDGRVIADMSGVDRKPLFIPDAESIEKVREGRPESAAPKSHSYSSGPEYLDKEGRRAMIGGALSAMLLVGGIIAAAFAVIILIIGHMH